MGEPSSKRSKLEWHYDEEDDEDFSYALSQIDIIREVDTKVSEDPQGAGPNRTIVREYAEVKKNTGHLQRGSHHPPQPPRDDPSAIRVLQEKLSAQETALRTKEKELQMHRGELSILRFRLGDAEKSGHEVRQRLVAQQAEAKAQLAKLSDEKEREVKRIKDETKFLKSDCLQARQELSRLNATLNGTLNGTVNGSQTLSQAPSTPTRVSPRRGRQTPAAAARPGAFPGRDSFYAPLPKPSPSKASPAAPLARRAETTEAEVQTLLPAQLRTEDGSEEADSQRVSLSKALAKPHLLDMALERLRDLCPGEPLLRGSLRSLPTQTTLRDALRKRRENK